MDGVFRFSDLEEKIIERMFKDKLPARQIAKILDKPPVEVSAFIKTRLMKRAKPPTVIGKNRPEIVRELVENVKLNRVTGGLRHYNDPLAAKEGSRKLLEALHAYYEKREKADAT